MKVINYKNKYCKNTYTNYFILEKQLREEKTHNVDIFVYEMFSF